MNYNMQGKLIPELFVVLKAVKVEVKKEHQVLMVNKTTGFKKGKKVEIKKWCGTFRSLLVCSGISRTLR